jgi:hypothetical protein
MTETSQPLDHRIWGSLKQQARARWNSGRQGITNEFHSRKIMMQA